MIDYRHKIEASIRDCGQFVQHVLGNPPWSYTIGNVDRALPELVIFGIPMQSAHPILNDAGERMRKTGTPFRPGSFLTEIASLPVRVDEVHPSQILHNMNQAIYRQERLGRDPSLMRALQLVWPDPNGIFPEEPGHDAQFSSIQPLLSLPTLGDPAGHA